MKVTRTVMFVGGGTGGHIFPNIGVQECLRDMDPQLDPHFLVSTRPIDASILSKQSFPFTPLPMQPPPFHPREALKWPRFVRGWFASSRIVRRLLIELNPIALVTTGGFVAAPVVLAAKRAGVPIAMAGLDAVTGKANRVLAGRADRVFVVYDHTLKGQRIGLPLRRSAIGPGDPESARQRLGLDPKRHTLVVTGGSQGAESINRMMVELLTRPAFHQLLHGWQIYHLMGDGDPEPIRNAYHRAGLTGKVESFSDQMGLVWSSASVAISRAGAGSVAEAWGNGTCTVFIPYPYHRDQHQLRNVQRLVDMRLGSLHTDRIDPIRNADEIIGSLSPLIKDPRKRAAMSRGLRDTWPGNGAEPIAHWIVDIASAKKG